MEFWRIWIDKGIYKMIIGAVGTLIKYLIRFSVILSILVALLIGGYTSFLHKEHGLFDNLKDSITKTLSEEIGANVKIGTIKESWSLSGVSFTLNDVSLVYKENTLESKMVNLDFEPLPLLLKKELNLNTIHFQDAKLKITKKSNLIMKEGAKKRENRKDFLYALNQLTKTEIKFDRFSLEIPEENINLKNLSVKKSANDMMFTADYDKKVRVNLHYTVDEEMGEATFKAQIDSSRNKLKSMISYAGKQSLLELIHFDKIYTVIGNLKSDILFSYNYKKNVFSDYKIKIHLDGNKIILKSYDPITLTNARGTLFYDKKGFYSDRIKGNLNKKSSILQIEQKNKKNITFNFETQANIEKLSEIANFPLEKILKGKDSFKGAYELNFDKADRLWVESDFKGIDYTTKTKLKTNNDFYLEGFFDYEKDKMNFDIKQGDHEIALNFLNGHFHNVSLGINKTVTKQHKEKGFFVNGLINDVEIVSFLKDLKELSKKFKKDRPYEPLNDFETLISINLQNTIIESETYENIDFLYQNNTVSLTVDEEQASGYLYYDEIENELEINLDKFKIKTQDAKTLITEDLLPEVNETEIDLKSLFEKNAKVKVEIKDLTFDEIKDSINFIAEGNVKDGILELKSIILNDKAETFLVEGSYIYNSIEDKSYLIKKEVEKPLIQIFDIDKFQMEMKGASSGITSNLITLDGGLSWDGFNLREIGESLSGEITLDVEEGQIPKNLQGVGILKTMNLFNFDSWLQMFSFNFESVEQGLHFNSIKGEFKIENNVVKIEPRIVLDSDLFILEMRGEMDYIESKYSLSVDAVVPLLNKAPAIALFAGVAPEVVGIIWLVDKIAGDVISETFTRASFDVSGTFENPVFKKGEEKEYGNNESSGSDAIVSKEKS